MNQNVRRLLIIPCIIAVGGFMYNIFTGFEGIVIIPKFFPDGEDVHLGTLLIWIGIGSSLLLLLISRLIPNKAERPHFSREIEDAFKEQHSKKTLPKDFSTKGEKGKQDG